MYGPGIEHGILSHFKSNFVVETKGAGAGQLTVRVRGPKVRFLVIVLFGLLVVSLENASHYFASIVESGK